MWREAGIGVRKYRHCTQKRPASGDPALSAGTCRREDHSQPVTTDTHSKSALSVSSAPLYCDIWIRLGDGYQAQQVSHSGPCLGSGGPSW